MIGACRRAPESVSRRRVDFAGRMATIPVVISDALRCGASELGKECVAALEARFTYANPQREKLERMGRRDWRIAARLRRLPRWLRTWRRDGDVMVLPRGAARKLVGVLEEHGHSVRWRDQRSVGTGGWYRRDLVHRPLGAAGGELRWYQREAVEAAVDRQCGIIRAPTGSGKTTLALALAARLKVPTLVVVWSGGLMDQWVERLARELGLANDEIGRVGGGVRACRPITVAMQQSLWRDMDEDFVGRWGMVLLDEVQRAAARTFFDVVGRFPAKYRVGVSADETRADGLEPITYDLFGPLMYEVTREALIDEGAVLDVEVRLVESSFDAAWYRMQAASGAPDFNRLLNEMSEDEDRNRKIVTLAAREVRAGHSVAVLSRRVQHCHRLVAMLAAAGVEAGLMTGGAEEFEPSRRRLLDGTLKCVVGTVEALGTGIDVPDLSRGILVAPIGDNRQLFGQVRGRFARPGKQDAVLFVMWDRVNGRSVERNLRSWNRRVTVEGSLVEQEGQPDVEEGDADDFPW